MFVVNGNRYDADVVCRDDLRFEALDICLADDRETRVTIERKRGSRSRGKETRRGVFAGVCERNRRGGLSRPLATREMYSRS